MRSFASYTYPCTSTGAIGARATEPSWNTIEFHESFQFWLSMPCDPRRKYSTKPSPSRSPYESIQSSALRAACSSSRTIASSPLHRHSSDSRTRKSGVASTVP
jgi:hypothetical protein